MRSGQRNNNVCVCFKNYATGKVGLNKKSIHNKQIDLKIFLG